MVYLYLLSHTSYAIEKSIPYSAQERKCYVIALHKNNTLQLFDCAYVRVLTMVLLPLLAVIIYSDGRCCYGRLVAY